MAVIKYRNEDGNLVAVGAGNHTHSPSDIGAADRVHGHTEATQETPGFMSKNDKTALDQAVQDIKTLDTLVGNTPVNELISSALVPLTAALDEKVKVVPGKQLSTEDYTTDEKNKLKELKNYELPTAGKDQLGGVKTSSTVTSSSGYTACPIVEGVPYYKNTNTNTTNTTGSSDTSGKIFLVGATTQSSTGQITYSHDTVYVDTDGNLHSGAEGKKVSVEGHNHNDAYYTYTEVDNKFSTFENVISEQMSASIQSVTQDIEDHAAVVATTSAPGHMSKTDKVKLDGLATVATSGSYNDLSNKPTIPAAYDHPSSHPASMITGLATVATSGSYNDLSNKPTIPSAYTHPTTAGNKHIPSGGSSGQILRWSSAGTATWGAENNTTYNNATQSVAGLMSAADKKKLDGMIYTIDVKRDPNYVPGSNVGDNVITIVLPS